MKNKKLSAVVARAAVFVAVATMLAGCFGEPERIVYEPRDEVIVPPSFLAGAAGMLLTNASGFSARLTVEPLVPSKNARVITGRLLGQGSHLVYSPTGGDRMFIWDVNEHSGWILSEALQGYAPISSAQQFTSVSVISEAAGPASDRVNGHPGHEVELSVAANDGAPARFSIWRASDLNGLPVRIKTVGPDKRPTVQLSEARRETLSPSVFQPPEGFVKFASAEAMADEIFSRKAKMRGTPYTGSPVKPPLQAPQRPTQY